MRTGLRSGILVGLLACASVANAIRAPITPFDITTGPGPIVRIGCRQGECSWQQQRDAAVVRRWHGETIVRLRLRFAMTVHGIARRVPDGWRRGMKATWRDETDYVRCSTRRPALLWRDADGGVYLHQLNLFALAGYQQNSANTYMLACHGRAPGSWGDALLKRLAYSKSPSDQTSYDTIDSGLAALMR